MSWWSEWRLARKVRMAERQYQLQRQLNEVGLGWHEARPSCHEAGRGHLACNGKHI